MKARCHYTYTAKVNYHRTDDLKPELTTPRNGEIVICSCYWFADEDEKFSGDGIFKIRGYTAMLPERDLILLKELKITMII